MTGSEARKEGRKGSCVQAGRQKAECCQLKRLGEKCHWPDLRRTVVTPKAHSGVEHPTRAEELPDFLSRTTTYQGKKGGNQGADSAGANAIHWQPFAARAGRAAARRPRRRRGSQTCTPRGWRSARKRGGAVSPGMATGGLRSRMRSGMAAGSTTSSMGGSLKQGPTQLLGRRRTEGVPRELEQEQHWGRGAASSSERWAHRAQRKRPEEGLQAVR